MTTIPPEEREKLFERVDVRGPDDCWLWHGSMDGRKHGNITIDGEVYKVHRVVYSIYNQELGDHQVNHHCDIRNCVNPNHLYRGDQSDNINDMWTRGRRDKEEMRGENSPSSKLTNEQADEIKERIDAGDETYAEIAEDYPVTKSTIGSIAAGEVWSYDDEDENDSEDAQRAQ